MYRPDPNYEYSVIDVVPQNGFTTYFLNMTSQQWYDGESWRLIEKGGK